MSVALPIDPHLSTVRTLLADHHALVLTAEPGAGKTTRVPPALLPLLSQQHSQVVVLEPRRLAARLAAARVAQELGTRLGDGVGYQVRFEDVTGSRTRIRFVTEGVLVRQLLADPHLRGVGAVVLDEFHERHLHTDLALGLLARMVATTRTDLKLVVMSATLDAAPVARFLGDAPVLHAEGRIFPVTVEHAATPQPVHGGKPLERQVADAVAQLLPGALGGHVLVFLPGMAEIRRAQSACQSLAQRHGAVVVPLHADLEPAEQDRAVGAGGPPRVILSTNVAESSVTIDGVVAVVDSGLARMPLHAAWSGVPVLKVARVSRASAIQRAGRAGRTGPGRAIRLYTQHDFLTRPEHTTPEIRRLDLAETALVLHGLGHTTLRDFPFFEAPDAGALAAADALLRNLGAVDAHGVLTPTGQAMLAMPLHPRQARVLVEAARRGLPSAGAQVAAILSEGGLAARHAASSRAGLHSCDVMVQRAAWDALGGSVRGAEAVGLDPGAVARAARTVRSLMRAARWLAPKDAPTVGPGDEDAVLQMSILAGYPDRVGRRRGNAGAQDKAVEVVLAGGGTALLDVHSAAAHGEFVVALDAQERSQGGRTAVRVAMATAVEPEWLLDVVPHLLTDDTDVTLNTTTGKVEAYSRMRLLGLVVDENRLDATQVPQAAGVLARAALAMGPRAFCDPDELAALRARLALLAAHAPEVGAAALDDAVLATAVEQVAAGKLKVADLQNAGVLDHVVAMMGPKVAAALERHLPTGIKLPGGRRVKVQYVEGQPPWVESRLQDFFGMLQPPALLRGAVPLNLHLLAPNGRAVQVTSDLSGFWDRHYPSIRKELMRRYPRHAWPEDPRTAQAPSPGRR